MPIQLWNTLRADLYRYSGEATWRAFISAYFRHPGFRFTFYMRKTAFYQSQRRSLGIVGYLYNRILWSHYRIRYGFDISPLTVIGPGFHLGHFGGVVISPYAGLGCNVNIGPGVTIGAESRGERKGAPAIGDRVWIGAHAIVVGRITIGDDVLIAPGAFVNFNVPTRSVVIGNPGKVVSTSGSAGYINRVMETE
jgi:serine O-acetyltransferase